jgi:glycosyltransferase involved in cell wall biosynthesis
MTQSSTDRGRNAVSPPLVTAVVPSRNHARYVAQALESVCAQTHRPLELVVIDDGSTDASATDASATVIEGLLPECRARLDHVVFERRRHRGLTRTLNRALTLARGEYVSIVASDDRQRPAKIERLPAAPGLSSGRAAVAFGDAQFIDPDGQPIALDDNGIAAADDPNAETSELRRHLRAWPRPFPEPLGTYRSLLRGSYIPAAPVQRNWQSWILHSTARPSLGERRTAGKTARMQHNDREFGVRVILAAGGYRSGSTLQYNLIGGYLERAALGERVGFVNPAEADSLIESMSAQGRWLVVAKCPHVVPGFHDFGGADTAWARLTKARVASPIVTQRRAADVERSMCRKFGYPTPEELHRSAHWREDRLNQARWRELGAIEQQFEDLVESPLRALHELVDRLDIGWYRRAAIGAVKSARRRSVQRQMKTLEVGTWHPVTLIHHDHIDLG